MGGNLGKTRPGAGYSSKGSKRQRHRRREVAGPYRSQSSVPSIRAEATPGEHRTAASTVRGARAEQAASQRADQAVHSILSRVNLPSQPADPRSTLEYARVTGDTPPTGPTLPELQETQPRLARLTEKEQLANLAEHENLGEPADLTNAILLASGIGEVGTLLRGAGELGAKELAGEAASAGAKQLAGTAEANSLARALAGIGGKRAAVRGAISSTAKRAEPTLVRDARQAVGKGAARAAEKVPKPVRVAGKVGARAATYPVKHPISAPLAIQAPAAAVHGDPKEFLKALEGKGTLASIAGAGSHIAPIVGEAAALPAAVLPTAFLTGRAGINAVQGNPEEWDELKKQYLETGLIPALAAGNPGTALKRLGEHPVYSGLEASLLASVLGRGAGITARGLTGDQIGGLERPDLTVRGTPVRVGRGYSRDLIRQGIQRGFDRAKGNEIGADTFRGRRKLKEAANRWESGQEAIRKSYGHQDVHALKKALPKKWGRIDRKSAEVVNLAVERIVRHPETFHEDLPLYKKMLDEAAQAKRPDGKPLLDKAQRANNKALRKQIDVALKGGNPEAVVHSANAFIELQQPILKEMVDLKLIDADQAAKASAVPFARVHLGSTHGVPPEHQPYIAEKISAERQLANAYEKAVKEKAPAETIAALSEAHTKAVESIARAEEKHSQHLDAHGNPLSLDQITAEMQRHGVEAPGFLSHRSPTPGDFYQPNVGGAILPRGVRTGESVATGSQLGGIEALARQLHRGRGLVLRAKAWNKAITDFGLKVRGIDTAADARLVNADPARYGLDPSLEGQLVAVPRFPFGAKKEEIAGALEHQDPSIAGELASNIVHGALDAGIKGELAPDTKVVLFPKKVAEEMRAGVTPAGPGLRGAQAATTLFTRTVLPFSPGWYLGNFFDNYTRTVLAGVNPVHYAIGNKLRKGMSVEHEAELLAGAHYASLGALNPHRSVESLIRGYDPVSKTIREAATWGERHGKGQAVAKFGPRLLSESSNLLVKMNSFLTEDLPQRAVLGKTALNEFRATQHSWVKALTHQKKLAESFQKGLDDPATMIRFQKALEEVQGNYTRMSPAARKYLRNVSPFWTWFRAAYKFVYATMPAHHPIQTGLLTAGARATKPTREEYGLVKAGEGGEKPLPDYMQSAIPLRGGGAFPLSSYSSFGYASSPIEAVARLPFSSVQSVVEALRGRDWKGEQLEGGDSNKIATALWSLATAFIPGTPLFAQEKEGKRSLKPELPSLPHVYDKSYLDYKRQPTQQITVPAGGSGSSSSGPDYGNIFGGGGGSSGVNYGAVFGGG
jgi:hypothetical protein